MKLEQMRAIATELGTGAELPPLQGGALAWPIYIPPFITPGPPVLKKLESSTQTSPRQNLLSTNSPTVMEEWELVSIWIPTGLFIEYVTAEPTQEEYEKQNARIIGILRIGGDIIWTQEVAVTGAQLLRTKEGKALVGTVTLAENFTNPFPLQRGRTLTLEVSIQASNNTAGAAEIFTFGATPSEPFVKTTSIASTSRERNEGTVNYQIEALSGHRVIAG